VRPSPIFHPLRARLTVLCDRSLAANEIGKGGLLQTLGGVVVGALGAKAIENETEKRKTRKDAAMRNAAPFKDDAIRDRRSSYPSRPARDDFRSDYGRSRTRSRSRPRRESPYRRGPPSDDYSDYSRSRYSPPPRMRD
jgi:hypothetical protein